MLVYSDKEVEKQVNELYYAADSLPLSDWERDFINNVRGFITYSDKQKAIISKLYVKHLEAK